MNLSVEELVPGERKANRLEYEKGKELMFVLGVSDMQASSEFADGEGQTV